jgi:outer membrane immunogenic protein
MSDGWLVGIETDIDASGIKGRVSAGGALTGSLSGSAALSAGSNIDYIGTLRARVGHEVGDQMLVYATGGLAYGGTKSQFGINVLDGTGATVFSAANSTSAMQTGWAIGGGAEIPVSERITFRAEYLYVDLGKDTLLNTTFLGGAGSIKIDAKSTASLMRIAFNYKL